MAAPPHSPDRIPPGPVRTTKTRAVLPRVLMVWRAHPLVVVVVSSSDTRDTAAHRTTRSHDRRDRSTIRLRDERDRYDRHSGPTLPQIQCRTPSDRHHGPIGATDGRQTIPIVVPTTSGAKRPLSRRCGICWGEQVAVDGLVEWDCCYYMLLFLLCCCCCLNRPLLPYRIWLVGGRRLR